VLHIEYTNIQNECGIIKIDTQNMLINLLMTDVTMDFESLLHIILYDILISDIINIIYHYAIRYSDPVKQCLIYYNDPTYYLKYKYIVDTRYWFDHESGITYVNNSNKIEIRSEQHDCDYEYDMKYYIGQSIDVLYDKICTCDTNTINILDKDRLILVHKISTRDTNKFCIFVNEHVILSANELVITLYDINTNLHTLTKKFDSVILGVGANHDHIFVLLQYDTQGKIILFCYDHDLCYVNCILSYRTYLPCRMRVYDNTCYISNPYFTRVYKMNIL
jgi:hypothetical protein